jgi:hypothetical protein
MKNIVGLIMGVLFVGAFSAAGPTLLTIALVTTAQRTSLIASGQRADGTVIAKQSSPGRSHPTFAPVFQFTATDGQLYTVAADVSGRESAFKFGQHVQVLYRQSNPTAARINAFGQLWTLPLVTGIVGTVFTLPPVFLLVNWLRQRRGKIPMA